MKYPKRKRFKKFVKGKAKGALMKKLKRMQFKANAGYVYTNAQPIGGWFSTTSLTIHLTNISQGNTATGRMGNSIRPVRLRGDYTIYFTDNTAGSAYLTYVRCLLLQGTPSAGALPVAAQVLIDPASDRECVFSGFDNDTVQLKKIDTSVKGRTVRVLKDSGARLLSNMAGNGDTNITSVGCKFKFVFDIPWTKMNQVDYTGVGGASFTNQPISLMVFSNNVAANAHSPLCDGTAVLYYDNVV